MFIMPVSTWVEVEVPDDATPEEAIQAAEEMVPGHNSNGCDWDSSDASAFDVVTNTPHAVEIDDVDVTDQWEPADRSES
jgi:hypothetical protein